MTVQLTDEMRQALQAGAGKPVTLEDGLTQEQYVLLPAATWQRVSALFADDGFGADEAAAAQSAVAGAAGWDDPEMDLYDDYDAHKARP